LAEVALGKPGQGFGSSANEKNMLAKGFNSTHVDCDRPDPKDSKTIFGDVLVPYGKYENCSCGNMYIVYNTN
jgi:hypothetical protein